MLFLIYVGVFSAWLLWSVVEWSVCKACILLVYLWFGVCILLSRLRLLLDCVCFWCE